MNNSLFSHISSDYYTRDCYARCYEINPNRFGGMPVKICVECRKNTKLIDYEYYWIDLYLSIGKSGVRDFLIGVFFGEEEMDQKSIDAEIDRSVDRAISEPDFFVRLQDYLVHFL